MGWVFDLLTALAMVRAHPIRASGSEYCASIAYSLRFNEPKLAHKSHWGNSHYLLFNRFADTDCTWILLDLFGFKNSTATTTTTPHTQCWMGVEMELDFQRRASTNRRTFEQDRFPWKNELLLLSERKIKREKAAEKTAFNMKKWLLIWMEMKR